MNKMLQLIASGDLCVSCGKYANIKTLLDNLNDVCYSASNVCNLSGSFSEMYQWVLDNFDARQTFVAGFLTDEELDSVRNNITIYADSEVCDISSYVNDVYRGFVLFNPEALELLNKAVISPKHFKYTENKFITNRTEEHNV